MTSNSKKKFAIITSYDEECGIAFHSLRLKTNLEKYADCRVDIIKLDSVLRNTDQESNIIAQSHIQHIINQMQDYDGISLQLEPGLYSSVLSIAYKRVLQILQAHSNIVITLHSLYYPQNIGIWGILRNIYKRNKIGVLNTFWDIFASKHTRKFWQKVAKLDTKILTLCNSDKHYLKHRFKLNKIESFPVTYYSQEEVALYKNSVSRKNWLEKYNLDPAKKYIGIFGFIGKYKGHLVALKALDLLPEDYELLIIGGEHPHGLEIDSLLSTNLKPLIYYLYPSPNMKLAQFPEDIAYYLNQKSCSNKRAHFIGQLKDAEMPAAYSVIDYAILPYLKPRSGQSASGPAIFALEFGCRAIFSNAPVFRELEQYYKNSMMFVGIGNYIELAEAILRYDNFVAEIKASRENNFQIYNPENMVTKHIWMWNL